MKRSALVLLVLTGCATSPSPANYEDAVASEINRRYADYQDCYDYDRNKATSGTPSGRVTLAFAIGPNGKTSNERVTESSLQRPEAEACLISVLKSMQFPAPEKVRVEATHSFRFDP